MNQIQQSLLKGDIALSLKICKTAKIVKIILAICLLSAYLVDFRWLQEILIMAVILCLVVPLGFFDVFIQKLLEYNTQLVEERQLLNATEASKHVGLFNDRIGIIEDKIL